MIKGIYNENEFYTNFYWDSKFLEDLRSKVGEDATTQASVAALKGLDAQFWAMKEMSEGGTRQLEAMADFYKSLFQALGYRPETREHQTSSGQAYSHFVDVERSTAPELFAVLVNQPEMGAFETPPVFFKSDADSEIAAVDFELSEVLREELQDSQNPPRWILVGAPNALFIIERNKWSFGRYLRIEWQEIFLQRDAKPYEVLFGLVAKRIFCPETGNSPHDEFDDNSHRHAFEVTTELRESVREAIELLINEMIDLKKESHQKIYSADTAEQYAAELTHDALYYVYRLLFLLYLEAQGDDSDLLPLKSEIYRNGYSLEKLVELDFVEIAPDSVESRGTFLFESLDQIFNLIFFGFEPGAKEGLLKREESQSGFLVKGIKSDLFDPKAINHLKGVKLRNAVLLEILKKLSLTRKKERGGKLRSRVSYANLGINQLGAVYEGLLSYTGFFAQEDLHALKPTSVKQSDIDNGKELDQVYLAPKSLVDKYRKTSEKKYKLADENTVLDESGNPKVYKKGSFIYRLAGRDRQKLASYYTPESLTKCTVKYSLKVLFETKKNLDDLWSVRILEPAMGSGAFLNEAVNQLAEKILELEIETGVGNLRTPKDRQRRLWTVKYQLIANNVYGVDLNPTAIELARFSLWLNCIGAGKEPPNFDGRLKVGNSLTGARFKKGADGVYPWLLLDDGMMNYGKRLKDYDPIGFEKIQSFRKSFIGSKMESSHSTIRLLQEKIESVRKELSASSDFEKKRLAYEKLKVCADLWCSAFFLTSEDLDTFPANHDKLCSVYADLLDGAEIDPKLHQLISEKSKCERYFHWEIEFPEVISSGGFDLILGNPPWLAVEWQDSLFLSDLNPIPVAKELSAGDTRTFVDNIEDESVRKLLINEFISFSGYTGLLDTGFYSALKGVQKNTYKAFDVLCFFLLKNDGTLGVIQEDGILDDKVGVEIRAQLYSKYAYHFQFQNEKKLFSEVGNAKRFSINIFTGLKNTPDFKHIGNLFLPSTIDECFDGTDAGNDVPLVKDLNGNWETRGHQDRLIEANQKTLKLFSAFLGDPDSSAPAFLNVHSNSIIRFIEKIGKVAMTLETFVGGQESCVGSRMFDETDAGDDGLFIEKNGKAKTYKDLILSGPHVNPFNPISKETRETYQSKFSYDDVDLEGCENSFVQRTLFHLTKGREADERLPKLRGRTYRSYYRLLTRNMISPTNERCMFTCIIPPGVSHISSLDSLAIVDESKLPLLAGITASLIFDGIQRLRNKTHFFNTDFKNAPIGDMDVFFNSVARRTLPLNGLTEAYNDLWLKCSALNDRKDNLINGIALNGFGTKFDRARTIRTQSDRDQAIVEVDALVGLIYDLSAEELVQVYEILFPVLNMYDRKRGFDRKAKLIAAHKFFKTRGW